MKNESLLYYQHKARFNRLVSHAGWDTRQAAALFYYLNRTGYNGLCRFNSKGEFNVPFGRHKTINYRRDFRTYRSPFAGFEFTDRDFEGLQLEPTDFVYADPPYDVPFTRYAKDGFSWGTHQKRAARWLAQHPGPVVLSNQATDRVLDLYFQLGFELRKVLPAPRFISRTGDRTPALEVLAVRNL